MGTYLYQRAGYSGDNQHEFHIVVIDSWKSSTFYIGTVSNDPVYTKCGGRQKFARSETMINVHFSSPATAVRLRIAMNFRLRRKEAMVRWNLRTGPSIVLANGTKAANLDHLVKRPQKVKSK